MATVGNIGIGLLLLIILWILTLCVFVYSVKAQSNIGWISLAVATVITIILVVIPVENKEQKLLNPELQEDYESIYRSLQLVFLSTSLILLFVYFFFFHCIDPVRPKLLKSF